MPATTESLVTLSIARNRVIELAKKVARTHRNEPLVDFDMMEELQAAIETFNCADNEVARQRTKF